MTTYKYKNDILLKSTHSTPMYTNTPVHEGQKAPMLNDTGHILDARVAAFLSEFNTQFVATNRSISTSSIALFAESAHIVPDNKVLTGGPDFFRMPCPPLPAFFVIDAIDSGGGGDLVEMMNILRDASWTEENAIRMATAAYRFMQRFFPLIDDWVALWNESPTDQ